jgi:hypothetical protein
MACAIPADVIDLVLVPVKHPQGLFSAHFADENTFVWRDKGAM